MENTKEFNVNLINEIYLIEKRFKSICNGNREQLLELENLKNRMERLDQAKFDEEILEIKKELENVSKRLLEVNKEIEEIKDGQETLFDWRIMNKKFWGDFVKNVIDSDFKSWLTSKIEKKEKLIFSEIDLNDFETMSLIGDYESNLDVVSLLKLEDYSKVYIILNSPFNIKGKETATIYFPKLKNREEFINRCSVTDIISMKLLNASEEFDLDILNNLKENNTLSKLYELAYEEAEKKIVDLSNKTILNDLTKNINNYFLKKNLE